VFSLGQAGQVIAPPHPELNQQLALAVEVSALANFNAAVGEALSRIGKVAVSVTMALRQSAKFTPMPCRSIAKCHALSNYGNTIVVKSK
jgi:hypothetical protein